MAGSSLLMLLDDLASMMEKVSVMAKAQSQIIAKSAGSTLDKTGAALSKAGGVVTDDIAVSTQSLRISEMEARIGAMAHRELYIVRRVAQGSAINKLFLIAGTLFLMSFAPIVLTLLLILGGLYLSMEGAEKVIHSVKPLVQSLFGHSTLHSDSHLESFEMLEGDALRAWEDQKIQGAIKTDLVLSGEIIVLSSSLLTGLPFLMQLASLFFIAFIMTVGVYGLVAALVKLDDLGLFTYRAGEQRQRQWLQSLGTFLMSLMPKLMKILTFVGVAAMLVVGGEILLHQLPFGHSIFDVATSIGMGIPTLFAMIFAFISGTLTYFVMESSFVHTVKTLIQNRIKRTN